MPYIDTTNERNIEVLVSDLNNNQINYLVECFRGYSCRYPWMLAESTYTQWQASERAWGTPVRDYCHIDPEYTSELIDEEGISSIPLVQSGKIVGWTSQAIGSPYYFNDESRLKAAMKSYIASKSPKGNVVILTKAEADIKPDF